MELLELKIWFAGCRHLRGNWLAYWEHESGRHDRDFRFNFKQIRLLQFSGHTAGIRSIHVMDSETGMLTAGRDKTARVWNLQSQVSTPPTRFGNSWDSQDSRDFWSVGYETFYFQILSRFFGFLSRNPFNCRFIRIFLRSRLSSNIFLVLEILLGFSALTKRLIPAFLSCPCKHLHIHLWTFRWTFLLSRNCNPC